MDAQALRFADNRFDGIVLRDSLHHLWEESDLEKTFAEIEQVLKPGGVLVIFDPNPNFVVRMCRRIARHQDAQCTFRQARIAIAARLEYSAYFLL